MPLHIHMNAFKTSKPLQERVFREIHIPLTGRADWAHVLCLAESSVLPDVRAIWPWGAVRVWVRLRSMIGRRRVPVAWVESSVGQ